MNMLIRKTTLIVSIVCNLLLSVNAGQTEYKQTLWKPSIIPGTTISVYDLLLDKDKLSNTQWVSNRKATVKLYFANKYFNDVITATEGKWKYKINYSINYIKKDNSSFSTTSSLEIIWNSTGIIEESISLYNDINSTVNVTITSIEAFTGSTLSSPVNNPATSTLLPSDIGIEVLVNTERYFKDMLNTSTVNNINFVNSTLYWDFFEGAEEYDVEWVFIDYYTKDYSSITSNNAFNIKKPVRVTVFNNSYTIDNHYPAGKLFFRVRPVGRHTNVTDNNYSRRKNGAWQTCSSATTITGNELTKNWNYVASYAEDGMHKSVVTYADGTLRARQMLTALSSEGITLVGESKYDAEGRKAIDFMPVPVSGMSLAYKTNFNRNNTATAFNADNFDFGVSEAANLNYGSAQYYSPNNNITNDPYRNYIPNAEGYVYSETEYLRDNTGRVSRQSNPGKEFIMGSNKETRYYYGTPSTSELKQLFGSNVGPGIYYRKITQVDPNNQVSITFQDDQGRTIATALAGPNPDNLMPLPENTLNYVKFNINEDNVIDDKNLTSTTTKTYANVIPQNYIFEYNLTTSNPTTTNLLFDLELSIKDPDGLDVEIIKDGVKTFKVVIPETQILPNFSISSYFSKPGNYTITKKLIANKKNLEASIQNEISTIYNTTYLQTLINAEKALIDYTYCDHTLGDNDDAIAEATESFTQTCSSALEQMKKDVIPGGSHFKQTINVDYISDIIANKHNPNIYNFWHNVAYDVQNDHIHLTKIVEDWRGDDKVLSYFCKDEDLHKNNDNEDPCITNPESVPADVIITKLNDLKQTLATDWDNAWTDELVTCHREYCHYTSCINKVSTNVYNVKLLLVNNWEDAFTSGYLNPQYMDNVTILNKPNTLPLRLPLPKTLLEEDSDPYIDDLVLNAQMLNYKGTGLSIWDYVTMFIEGTLVTYDDPNDSPDRGNIITGDAISKYNEALSKLDLTTDAKKSIAKWQMFCGLYQGLKEYRFKNVIGYGKDCRFINSKDPYKVYFKDNFVDLTDETALINKMNEQMLDTKLECGKICEYNAKAWLEKLGLTYEIDWVNHDTEYDDIYAGMLTYCQDNCILNNPMGLITTNDLTTAGIDLSICQEHKPCSVIAEKSARVIMDQLESECGFKWSDYPTQETNVKSALVTKITSNCTSTASVNPLGYISPADFTALNLTLPGSCNYNPGVVEDIYTYDNQRIDKFSNSFNLTIEFINEFLDYYASTSPLEYNKKYDITVLNFYKDKLDYFKVNNTYFDQIEFYQGYLYNFLIYSNDFNMGISNYPFLSNYEAIVNGNNLEYINNYFLKNINNIIRIKNTRYTWDEVTKKYSIYIDYEKRNGDIVVIKYTGDIPNTYYFNTYVANLPNISRVIDYSFKTITGYKPGVKDPFSTPFTQNNLTLNCENNLNKRAEEEARRKMEKLINAMRITKYNEFYEDFKNRLTENFYFKFCNNQYAYTLYYYDLAGNLVQTVAPKGVVLLPTDNDGKVIGENNHTFKTTYKYNSLNQLIEQNTPDAGTTSFKYNSKGQLRYSQNAQQLVNNTFSYTKYDAQSRIIESGLSSQNFATCITNIDNGAYPNTGNTEITATVYDAQSILPTSVLTQENLRSRVVTASIDDNGDGSYEHASHYSYDEHGNVKTLLQDYALLSSATNQRYKRIDYDFDIISGNVKTVYYQKGQPDQYMHAYSYDADNRIRKVYTSKDGVIWSNDACYFYYLHGPLARVELAHHKVQGLDYTYTLQGWLKGVNSTTLDATRDIGKDGYNYQNSNSLLPTDVFGYSLGYYKNDYKPITTFSSNTSFMPVNISSLTDADGINYNLYNGNISNMVSTCLDVATGNPQTLATVYRYDQLNRLRNMDAYKKNTIATDNDWTGGQKLTAYNTELNYDLNGNILTLIRKGNESTTNMDQLTYRYPETSNNKLYHVNDIASYTNNYTTDIDNQVVNGQAYNAANSATWNYKYDLIGNLIQDNSAGITNIVWNNYGKIKEITKTNSPMAFEYDAMGNRILKKEYATSGTKGTYYVRDAQGNVMANYTIDYNSSNAVTKVTLNDNEIYGSSRLGIETRNLELFPNTPVVANVFNRKIGNKTYELTNHLGNVMATVSDKKIANHTTNSNVSENFENCSSSDATIFPHSGYYSSKLTTLGEKTPVISKEVKPGDIVTASIWGFNDDIPLARLVTSKIWAPITQPAIANLPYYIGFYMPTDLIVTEGACGNGIAKLTIYYDVWNEETHEFDGQGEDVIEYRGNSTSGKYEYYSSTSAPGSLFENITSIKLEVISGDINNSANKTAVKLDIFDANVNNTYICSLKHETYYQKNTDANVNLSYQYVRVPNEIKITSGTPPANSNIRIAFSGWYDYILCYYSYNGNGSFIYSGGDRTPGEEIEEVYNVEMKLNDNLRTTGNVTAEVDLYEYLMDWTNRGSLELRLLDENNNIVYNNGIPQVINTDVNTLSNWTQYTLNYTVPAISANGLHIECYGIYPSTSTAYNPVWFDDLNVNIQYAPGTIIPHYTADIKSLNDYYPFGMLMPGRNYNAGNYRFGFNGKEMDNEVKGTGVQYDYGFRIYDARIAKFLSVDPLTKSYPWWSPYAFAGNTPIQAIDLDGLEIYYAQSGQKIGTYGTSTEIRVVNDDQVATATTEFATYNNALKTDPVATNEFLGTTLSTTGSVAYNDYFTNVTDVTGGDALQTYGSNGGNCNAAAVKQLADDGVTQTGPGKAFHIKVNNALQRTAHNAQTSTPPTATGNTPASLATGDAIGASIFIQTQLNKGNPVMVGLENQNSAGNTIGVPTGTYYNYNALTGHFVVINSTTVDASGNVSFGYMDNASSSCGTNSGNQLSLDKTTGAMSDNTSPCTGGVSSYKVTEVRKNK